MSPEPLCVYCRTQPVDPAWRPFCSRRCQQQDLARWASGAYRIPGPPVPSADDDDEESDEDR